MQRASWAGVFLLVALASCSSISVKYDYDREVDFRAYGTYAWMEKETPDDTLAGNPLMKKRVRAAVGEVLRLKGYARTAPDQADFLVAAHAGVKDRVRVQGLGLYGGYDPWWGPYGGPVEVTYYEEGTLVIEIVDAGTKELVWRGAGTGIVRLYAKPEKIEKAVHEEVRKILTRFPPSR